MIFTDYNPNRPLFMEFDWRVAQVALTKDQARSCVGHKAVNIAAQKGWIPHNLLEEAKGCFKLDVRGEDYAGELVVKVRVHAWKVEICQNR